MAWSNGMARGAGKWALRLLLAYALLCQTVLGGIAATEHAVAIATGTLCQGAGEQGPQGHGGGGSHDGLCCALGCNAAGGPALSGAPAARIAAHPQMRLAGVLAPMPERAAPAYPHVSFAARGPPARG